MYFFFSNLDYVVAQLLLQEIDINTEVECSMLMYCLTLSANYKSKKKKINKS